ncbi:MAG TPA: peptidylprolyl isomerase, partial [Candidatus Limnocylindrales bacterium]|nr:peptidylprolyl isomerase [Candidatus Limnocylindrales bacterium]
EAVELVAAAKARGITARLRAAPSDQALWNRLAQELSDDPGSKFSGGDLGTVGKGQFVAEFEDAAQRLPVGAISDPVKTQFGYHVIQVKGRVPPQDSELVGRLLASGFSEDDIRAQLRWVALRQEFTRRAQEAALASPTLQIRLARIVINTPSPSSGDVEGLIEALRKVGEVGEKLREGVDFAEVALEYSDDAATKENGGEMGWIARGMLTDLRAEDAVFALAEGERTDQFVTRTQTAFYKVLERDEARELTDEQRDQLRGAAYPYWLEQKKLEHRAIPLLGTTGIDF